jgi:hypothetical protein
MPAKKKARSKKSSKSSTPSKRPVKKASKKKSAKPQARKTTPKKKAVRRSTAGATKPKPRLKTTSKTTTAKSARDVKDQIQDKSRAVYETGSARRRQGRVFSGRESGDLEGLSRREEADSESVDELLEEGNSFEAGVVAGVEEADDSDEKEVYTHEVPEDDVPDEYLDPDKD